MKAIGWMGAKARTADSVGQVAKPDARAGAHTENIRLHTPLHKPHNHTNISLRSNSQHEADRF